MKIVLGILGRIVMVAGIIASLYVGLWLCLVGGIIQIVDGIKANPTNGMDIGVGVSRVILTYLVTWGGIVLSLLAGGALITIGELFSTKHPRRW